MDAWRAPKTRRYSWGERVLIAGAILVGGALWLYAVIIFLGGIDAIDKINFHQLSGALVEQLKSIVSGGQG